MNSDNNMIFPQKLIKINCSADIENAAVSTFQTVTPKKVASIKKGWGGLLGTRIGDITFIGVYTLTKPSKRILTAIKDGKVFLPSHNIDDLDYIAKELTINSYSGIVELFEFANFEYGYTEKKTRAICLDRMESVFELPKNESGDEYDQYWWQEWGGKLYGITMTYDGLSDMQVLGTRYGEYSRLPKRVTR